MKKQCQRQGAELKKLSAPYRPPVISSKWSFISNEEHGPSTVTDLGGMLQITRMPQELIRAPSEGKNKAEELTKCSALQ